MLGSTAMLRNQLKRLMTRSPIRRPQKGAGPSRAADIPEPQNRDANVAGRECVRPSRSPIYSVVRPATC